MKKIDFQTKAEEQLVEGALTLLSRPGRGTITFKAPTGAGKTVMMANALAQLSKACEGKHRLAILWVAPNKLHEQSHARLLEVYGETKALECLFPEELTGTDIPEKAVLFLNWSSIDSETLILRRDNETRRNLGTFVDRARADGRKVVLVVDESHLHLDSSPQARVVVEHIIKPDLVVEVSATPTNSSPDVPVTVLREDVVAAGFVRKRIIVNPGEQLALDGNAMMTSFTGTSESLLDLALAKQAELTRLYRAEGSPVVPLILVQLPDRRANADALTQFEHHLLMKHGLSRGNGVEVWLSGDRTPELDRIADFGSTARVLFFKQAIATGWDCPRAQLLVGLREMKSETFTTQVLGRIIRQPQHRHYADDELNYGYAFTNYDRLELDAEAASWMGKVMAEAREPFHLPIPNWTARYTDRRHHLTHSSIASMLAHKGWLKGVSHRGAVQVKLLDVVGIDDIDQRQVFEGTRAVALDMRGLQQRMDTLKGELVRELAGQVSGGKYVEKALRDAAAEVAGTDDERTVLEAILHPENQPLFERMVEAGINDFKKGQEKAAREFAVRDSWEAPRMRFLDLSEPLDGYTKCLYRPLLEGQFDKSSVERPFTAVLEQDVTVEMWMKNGDHGQEHFAIKYKLNREEALFYPDFILRTKGGGIRLYDTKGSGASDISTGNTPDTYAKAEALAAYTAELRERGVDIDGGIVVQKKGRWWLHRGQGYSGNRDVSAATGWLPFCPAPRE